jgi:hypothetical protein
MLLAIRNDTKCCVNFLRSIGLDIEVVEAVPDGTVVPMAMLVAGTLRIDKRATPSEVLHEAGHLATMPTRFRHFLNGDIRFCDPLIEAALTELGLPKDHLLAKAVFIRNDGPAIAWSWAAGNQLGLQESLIIRDVDYSSLGWVVRKQLVELTHRGIAPLARAGMCALGTGGYPVMRRWVQDIDL